MNVQSDIKKKYAKNLDLNKRLYSVVDAAIEKINSAELREEHVDLFKAIVLSVLAKNRKHFNAARLLCEFGFGEEAGLIVRSMTNALIDVTYILRCGKEELAERFVRYDWIVKNHKVEIVEMLNAQAKTPFLGQEKEDWDKRKEEIRLQGEVFRNKYKSETRNDWSGYSIKAKAEKAGKDMELLYHTVYRYNSDIEHSNAAALDKYIEDEVPGKIQFLTEPSESHVEENLREGFNIFLRIAQLFFDAFGWKEFDEKIKSLEKDFLALYKT